MKIKGKQIEASGVEVVVIPRASGDLVFKAKSVTNFDVFDKLNPMPEPTIRTYPDGRKEANTQSDKYKKEVEEYATRKTNYTVLRSLEATEDLEWETVDMDKPETWENYQKELQEAGFSAVEISRIIDIAITACGFNQSKIDEATKSFLAGQGVA